MFDYFSAVLGDGFEAKHVVRQTWVLPEEV